MRVLMITGDRAFGPGHPRYELQRGAVEDLQVLYWGPACAGRRGSTWPTIPAGPFDVVTAQDPFWRGVFAWRAARRLGAKLNVQVHTDLSAYSFVRQVLAHMVLRHATGVRVVSEKIKNQVEQYGTGAKITVLPVYIDVAKFKNIERQPHDTKTILWFGRFEKEKDPLLALDILKQIPGAKLIMLGKGSLEKSLHTKAVGLPVEFPGWADPAPYLAQADVVLCTSHHESWGASMVEALAAGVPVVAPDVGVAKEAGAIVVPRAHLAQGVAEVLKSGARGELRLELLSEKEWAQAWKNSLV